jgi:hypothetical protein
VALGVWGDTTDWWDDVPFLTNLASSLTGAMFAIPLALVILGYLSAHQAEWAEARAASQLAQRAAATLHDATCRLVRGDDPAGRLRALDGALERAEASLATAANAARAMAGSDIVPEDLRPGAPRDFGLDESAHAMLEAFKTTRDLSMAWDETFDADGEFRGPQATWEMLSTLVKSRLIECGLPWLSTGDERFIGDGVTALQAPPEAERRLLGSREWTSLQDAAVPSPPGDDRSRFKIAGSIQTLRTRLYELAKYRRRFADLLVAIENAQRTLALDGERRRR